MAILVVLGGVLPGCDLLTDPEPVPATIDLSHGSVEFTALGDTAVLQATVRDQNGQPMPEVDVFWTSADPQVVSVSAQGTATAVRGGQTSFTASAERLDVTVPAQVVQVPHQRELLSGELLQGAAGEPAPESVRIQVRDRNGHPAEGVEVVARVVAGEGTVDGSSQEAQSTDAQGMAEFQWTFGPVITGDDASRQRLILEVPLLADLEVSAEVSPGPPSELMVVSGSGQVAHRATTLPEPIVVRLEDRFANPAAGLHLALDSKAGNGTLEPNTLETDQEGKVRITWTLGETEGQQSFQVMHESLQVEVVAEARIIPAELEALAGDGQQADPEEDLAEAFTVQLIDQVQLGVEGAQVRFTVTSGTARFSGEDEVMTTTDAGGIAESPILTLGPEEGVSEIQASVEGLDPVTFTATATSSSSTSYVVELEYQTAISSHVRRTFQDAAARWQQIVTGDLPSVNISISEGQCGSKEDLSRVVDDVLILVHIEPIDGPGGVLGSAGPCLLRSDSKLPILGRVRLDEADVQILHDNGALFDLVLHEIGHVLGFGTIWNTLGLLKDPAGPSNPDADPHFVGAMALQAFDDIGGDGYTGGEKVPVEDQGGSDTRNGHWRQEDIFENELMTGWLNQPAPLSRVTSASLGDLGYEVNLSASDNFSLSFADVVAARMGVPGAGDIHLGDDVDRFPLQLVDPEGRVVRTIQPWGSVPEFQRP